MQVMDFIERLHVFFFFMYLCVYKKAERKWRRLVEEELKFIYNLIWIQVYIKANSMIHPIYLSVSVHSFFKLITKLVVF